MTPVIRFNIVGFLSGIHGEAHFYSHWILLFIEFMYAVLESTISRA